MYVRLFLLILLAMSWGGSVLHHHGDDADAPEHDNCPVCQQIEETAADGAGCVVTDPGPLSTGDILHVADVRVCSTFLERTSRPRAPPRV